MTARIVVGVDGSASSRKALCWALRYAKLTGAEIEAITAWEFPPSYGWAPVAYGSAEFEEDASKILAEALAETSAAGADVQVEPVVRHGHPADVLVRAAQGADLLVVGSHGHGGFAGLLLGSVSLHCVHHAPCPVLIVPDLG